MEDQKMEGTVRTAVAWFERACHSALSTNLIFVMDSVFGRPLLNKLVALRSAMLWYSAAGAAAAVVALVLAGLGGRRRSAACRAAACAALASAAFNHCVFCGLLVNFLLTAHGGPILGSFVLVAAAFFLVFAVRHVRGFMDVLRGDGADGGKE